MYFSSNIKFLRKHRSRTQDDVAFALNMKRSTLSGYENEVAEPNIEALVAFSKYFNIAIDTLVKVNLSTLSEGQLSQLERGFDPYLKGSNLRILTTTVNSDDRENIELVTEKAKAGYATGFADPEYIKVLPTFSMPFLSRMMGGTMPAQITLFHTLFNVGTTLVLAFFIPQIAQIVTWLVPEKKEDGEEEFRLTYISPNMISTAELNLQSAKSEIEEFSKRVLRMYTFLPGLRTAKDDDEFEAIMKRIEKYEGITDRMEMEIANFLTKVGSGDISAHASQRITTMMRIVDNLESIGDTIYQIAMTRRSKREDAVHFDDGLNANLQHMTDLVQKALDVMDANLHDYDHCDLAAAYKAEEDINHYRDLLRARHLDALKLGVYNFGIGNAYSSLYALYEKLGDYIINVSEAIDNSVKAAETLGTQDKA